jgi:hypothetical protein
LGPFRDRQFFYDQIWFFFPVSNEIDYYIVFLNNYAGRRYLSMKANDPKHSFRTSIKNLRKTAKFLYFNVD